MTSYFLYDLTDILLLLFIFKYCSFEQIIMDYYGLLGISKNATDLEIKQAFKGLALQCMKNLKDNDSVEEFFVNIAEAFEVLTDDKLKAVYDQYGSVGLKAGVPTPDGFVPPYVYHGDCIRTFEEFFGTRSPYADILDVRLKPLPVYNLPEGKGVKIKPEPMIRPIYCTIEEIYQGCIKKMKIKRQEVISVESKGLTELREKILEIPIKPGMLAGTEIVFPNAGDEGPTVCPGDIIFKVTDRPHDLFVREGVNLVMTVHVTLLEALTGTTVTVKTPDYRTLRIPIHDIINPNYEKIVKNEGMPFLEDTTKKGDLIMRFNVAFPTYLPRASKNLIKKALNVCKMISVPGEAENINLRVLMDKANRRWSYDVCDPLPILPCQMSRQQNEQNNFNKF